ncbi:spore cortex biosynthesis protein YabQ [uncultured Clostridium sp.]|uniref:spore cortex biosynthesis protein YabQ n=1 Tax=uncultured Clostridium sp. TaxID=59620 RepID=UPI0025DE65F5|nr:spore cortex biosynthesis protein YabQ [uncultured Clostridium sp.]
MPLEINMQVNIVIYSFMAGIITGILFDIYRIFRGLNKIKIITIIEDLLFWSLSSLVIFTFLLYMNYAFLTLYVYIFMAISLALYLRFFSRFFYSFEKELLGKFYKMIRVTFKNITYPLKIVIYKVTDRRK